jgi:hypothetical protein
MLPMIASIALLPHLFGAPAAAVSIDTSNAPARCADLLHSLKLDNTTVLSATHIASPTTVSTVGTAPCQNSTVVSSPLCRLYLLINTTEASAVHAEAWLPDVWYGRLLTTGNGGTGGCKNTHVLL